MCRYQESAAGCASGGCSHLPWVLLHFHAPRLDCRTAQQAAALLLLREGGGLQNEWVLSQAFSDSDCNCCKAKLLVNLYLYSQLRGTLQQMSVTTSTEMATDAQGVFAVRMEACEERVHCLIQSMH